MLNLAQILALIEEAGQQDSTLTLDLPFTLKNKSHDERTKIVHALRKNRITTLNLLNIGDRWRIVNDELEFIMLERMSADELITVLASLQGSGITAIGLHTEHQKHTGRWQEIAITIRNLGILRLNLSDNGIDSKDLKVVLKTVHDSSITHLNIGGNCTEKHILKELHGSGVTHLTWGNVELGNSYKDESRDTIVDLHGSGITHLDLSNNNFWRRNYLNLVTAFKELPGSGITHLDLSDNGRFILASAVFSSLDGSGIIHLKYRNAWTSIGSDEVINEFHDLIQSGIPHVDLGSNQLGRHLNDENVPKISSIFRRSAITHLYLRDNQLFAQGTTTELVSIFEGLKDSLITHLDLSQNGIETKSLGDLETILAAIPPNIHSVTFSFSELKKLGSTSCKLIQAHFPKAKQIIIVDEYEQPISLQTREGLNLYRSLGFNTPVSSLLSTSTHFVAQNIALHAKSISTVLPSDLQETLLGPR